MPALLAMPSSRQARGELLVRVVEAEALRPDGLERNLERRSERWVLHDHHCQVGAAGDGILHAEHDVALVDDDELERELGDEPRLLTGVDEPADALDRLRVVEDRVLVDAAGLEGHRELGPLLADERMGTELIDTLQAYFDAGESIAEAARRLHLATRTVSYRMDRVVALLGHPLDGEARRRMSVALLIYRLRSSA